MDKLLTITEVAERLSVHPKTVLKWLHSGHLKGFQLGNRGMWRIFEADLADSVRAGATTNRAHNNEK